MTPDRVITLTRPDRTVQFNGSTINRSPNGVAAVEHVLTHTA